MAILEVTAPVPGDSVLTKQDLRERYDELLTAGLSPVQLVHYQRHGCFDDAVILQSTSGSTSAPLVLPRNEADMRDIGARITRPHVEAWGQAPERIALLGGISHTQALKLRMEGAEMRSFELAHADELMAFSPDFLSCYPSIARELMSRHDRDFPDLKTLKLGGERVLDVDVAKIHAVWPHVLIVEQLGSTEVPAVAIGVIENGVRRGLELQTERFSFQLFQTTDWQPLIVKDRFPNRMFPIDGFYDTGDEVRLAAGRINVQIDRARRTIVCDGSVPEDRLPVDGQAYRLVVGQMWRLPDSNKLPLLID
jgi:phenylacetate-coenzyme A ligase PaaK-like adenylate-forming protein